MIVSLIAAVSDNNVIGQDGRLPWHLPDDMAFFKNTTIGHHVIIGRKNYESIPAKFRPLQKRTNIIVSRQSVYKVESCVVVNSLQSGIEYASSKGETEVFIIGGGEIYKQSIALVDKMYISWVHGIFEGDVFFPELDLKQWRLLGQHPHPADALHSYGFTLCIYEKIR